MAGTGSGSGSTVDEIPLATAAAWLEGESRLYQAVLSGADVYQRSLELVRQTLDHLRALGPSSGALLAAAAQGAGLVRQAVVEHPASTDGLPLSLIAQAALAMRHREVAAEQAALRRVRSLWAARSRGEQWAVLEVSGNPDGDPVLPYRRLEAEVATGRALLVRAVPDEQFRGVVHAVEPLAVDVESGAVREPQDDSVVATTHPTAAAREAQVVALRRRLSSS